MTEHSNSNFVAKSINDFMAELNGDIAGERVKKYIIEELALGRNLSDILTDPYVKNRISDGRIDELIANSDIINAVEENLKSSLKGE